MIGGKEEGPTLTIRGRARSSLAPRVSRTFETARTTGSKRPRLLVRMEAFSAQLGRTDEEVRSKLNGALRSILACNRRVRPSFSETFVAPHRPQGASEVLKYTVGKASVRINTLTNETEGFYLLEPPEYRYTRTEVGLVEGARSSLLDEAPEDMQVETPGHVRAWVERRGAELIGEDARQRGVDLGSDRTAQRQRVRQLTSTLGRYTAGLGVIEHLLLDPRVQDVFVDAPADANPLYVNLGGTGDDGVPTRCRTNVCLSQPEVEGLVARLRHASGRPFSESRPYLEHDLEDLNTRVTVIGRPLSPSGTAIAFRRHATTPWTLPKLIAADSLSPLAAGLLSFLVDGQSTILVAGGRGAGKTSLLGALVQEFPRSQRILTIEDTLELPVAEMQELGYKVQSMRVQSTLGTDGEMSSDDALRLALRLGDSALVLGEVRGQEARTLYEAMRAGNAGSAVMGTIHGTSARAVHDRVVHDLGIAKEAFRATDVVVVAGLRRPGGAQRQLRRVVEVAEVDKSSARAGKFRDLLTYDGRMDGLKDKGLKLSDRIGDIAESWGLSMDEAMDNIRARARIRELMVETSVREGRPELLEPDWVAEANNAFWSLVGDMDTEGDTDFSRLAEDWRAWWEEVTRDG
ncbi:MAG: type II/IV secretion system ATPase subunit [Thermoplasmata archaeon]|nr:MAG: type II/IV secretion system ATPase subunit [Thermoplasmata archaeon]